MYFFVSNSIYVWNKHKWFLRDDGKNHRTNNQEKQWEQTKVTDTKKNQSSVTCLGGLK